MVNDAFYYIYISHNGLFFPSSVFTDILSTVYIINSKNIYFQIYRFRNPKQTQIWDSCIHIYNMYENISISIHISSRYIYIYKPISRYIYIGNVAHMFVHKKCKARRHAAAYCSISSVLKPLHISLLNISVYWNS